MYLFFGRKLFKVCDSRFVFGVGRYKEKYSYEEKKRNVAINIIGIYPKIVLLLINKLMKVLKCCDLGTNGTDNEDFRWNFIYIYGS